MDTGYFSWITSAIHPMSDIETTSRIEPALIDEPSSAIADVVADLTAAVSMLGKFLHPLTAANLADADGSCSLIGHAGIAAEAAEECSASKVDGRCARDSAGREAPGVRCAAGAQ